MTALSHKDVRDIETLDIDETPPETPEDCIEEMSALLTRICKPKFRGRAQKRFRVIFQAYVRMAEDVVAHHMAQDTIKRVRIAALMGAGAGFVSGYGIAYLLVG
jgi:hypothetical protein